MASKLQEKGKNQTQESSIFDNKNLFPREKTLFVLFVCLFYWINQPPDVLLPTKCLITKGSMPLGLEPLVCDTGFKIIVLYV